MRGFLLVLLTVFFMAAESRADQDPSDAPPPCITSTIDSVASVTRDHPIIDGKMVWYYQGTCLWVTNPATPASSSVSIWQNSSVDDTTAAILFAERCQNLCDDAVENYNTDPKRGCAPVLCAKPIIPIITYPATPQ